MELEWNKVIILSNMKAGSLLVILFLFGIQDRVSGQILFSERKSYDLASALYASMIRIGDTLYLSGVASDTSQNFAQVQYPKNFVAVMDINGNDLYHKIVLGEWKKSYNTFFNTLVRTSNNGFAICACTADTNGLRKILLMKYDSAMNVTLIKEFQHPDSTISLVAQQMVQLKDRSFMIVAEAQFPNGTGEISLLKIDSNSNSIWWKDYDPILLSDVYPSIFQLTDTTFLIGCEHSNELMSPYSITSRTKFIVVDTGGNVINQWIDSNDSTFAPYGMLKTKDGGYAYCGRYMKQMVAPYDDVFTNGAITKLDSNFHLVWRTLFTNNQLWGNQFYQLRELSDGSLIAAGNGVGWISSIQANESTGCFAKVSANGDSLWSRNYAGINGADNDNVINDFELLSDGGIIGCGTSTDNSVNYEKQQAWLIRLDSMGCLIPGCDTLTATGLNPVLIEGSHTGIAVYPNPTGSLVYLLIKTDSPDAQLSFKVYDATGKLVSEEDGAVPDVTYLLHVNKYTAGVYFVQVLRDGVVVAYSEFVKE